MGDASKPHVTSHYSGTVTHMPPELIENGLVVAAGDVYAFGVIMWEAYSRLAPYKGLVHPQIIVGVVSSCLRPAFPSTCPAGYRVRAGCLQLHSVNRMLRAQRLRTLRSPRHLTRRSRPVPNFQALAERCWAQRPEERPRFLDVAKALRLLLHKLALPPQRAVS